LCKISGLGVAVVRRVTGQRICVCLIVVCHHLFSINSMIFYFQKPGGIIALLDEAWWVWCILYCTTCNQKLVNSWFLVMINITCFYIWFMQINIWIDMLLTMVLLFLYPVCISMFPKCTHESFCQKLYEKFKNNKRFSKPKLSRTAFTIQHYAGDVSICWNESFFASALIWINSFQPYGFLYR
jgi:hypothetical protein